MTNSIKHNLIQCKNQLPDNVELLAVSKTKPLSDIITAIEAGQLKFGENYLQEGVAKISQLNKDYPQYNNIEWHFIGHLQSNKAKLAVKYFSWIDSVDSDKISLLLQKYAHQQNKHLNVLLQLKLSVTDSNKSGLFPQQLFTTATLIKQQCPNLQLRGIMFIHNPQQAELPQFTDARKVFDQLHQLYGESITTLSMGMSDSLPSAIACRTTQVRIGTAIFNQRNYNNDFN